MSSTRQGRALFRLRRSAANRAGYGLLFIFLPVEQAGLATLEALDGIAAGKFERGAPLPESITIPEQFLEWDQEHFAKAVAALKAAKGEDLVKELNFMNAITCPRETARVS
jgi:hypothetical protein